MKILIVIFCSALAFNALADETIVFSTYAKSLHSKSLHANDSEVKFSTKVAQFSGTVKLTGVVNIDYERDVAYFYPDDDSLKKLPNIVGGVRIQNAEVISISEGKKVLNQLFTKRAILDLLVQMRPDFESSATVSIKNIKVFLGCGGQYDYIADLVSIKLNNITPARGVSASQC